MIQALEDMIRRFYAYSLEFKNSDHFTHEWCTLIPELELAYKTPIHASAGKTSAMLENGWTLNFQHNARKSVNDAFEYAKPKWDKSNKNPGFKVGDLILVSTLNVHNIKGPKKLKHSFSGPFIMKALHGTNAVEVELLGELEDKHPTFPISLVKNYTSSDKELFSLKNETPLDVPPLDQSEEKKVLKVLQKRRLRGKV
ncbi:hypothetical protein O181_045375 [Austropuccinia psidii MF-1]|uniref:Integrase catalytic domain-containing protein n=1 Tax=Austropuccinia psidii MF-1 TaxID=1389203 RepID=A0A9Q3HL56_9BASI|nr:hypothetical protein [Austropuccinia psidii MF-1]